MALSAGPFYQVTTPTLTDGQEATGLRVSTRGELLTALSFNAVTANIIGTVADALSNTSTGSLRVQNLGMRFNGTTWDRDRKANQTARLPGALATTNATVVKASAGDVFSIIASNKAGSDRWIKLYNKATTPTVGTDIPVLTLLMLPNTSININLGGHFFSAGISYALTQLGTDADATAMVGGDVAGLVITYA